MPYGTLYGLAPSNSDRTAFTLCVEPRAAKALHRSSAEPPSPHRPPDSVTSNWQTGDILIGRLQVTQNLFLENPARGGRPRGAVQSTTR
jgi:hypothetical protein